MSRKFQLFGEQLFVNEKKSRVNDERLYVSDGICYVLILMFQTYCVPDM